MRSIREGRRVRICESNDTAASRRRVKSMTAAARKLSQKSFNAIAKQLKHRDTQQHTMMKRTYEGFFTDFDEDCVDHFIAEEKTIGKRQTIGDDHNLAGAGLSVLGTGRTSLATLYDATPEGESVQKAFSKERPSILVQAKELLLRSECLVWPDSPFRSTWDILLLAIILYQAFSVPVIIAFPYIQLSPAYEVFEHIVTVFFIIDILVNFSTGYQKANGIIEMGAKEAALHYLKGWFILDLIASFPYAWMMTAIGGTDSAGARGPNLLRILRVGRIARGLKLVRVLKLKSVMDELSMSLTGTALIESFIMTIIGMVKFSILVMLIAHWIACAFGMVGWELYRSGSENWIYGLGEFKGLYPAELVTLHQRPCTNSQAAELLPTAFTDRNDYSATGDRICVVPDVFEAYLRSMFWSLQTIAAVGYGNVYARHWGEHLYSIIAMLLGCAAFGLTVGYVQTLYSPPDVVFSHFQLEQKRALSYFKRNLRLPSVLMEKVRTYFRAQEERHRLHRAECDEILNMLSLPLRCEVQRHIRGGVLNQLPMFSECPNVDAQLPTSLVLKLVPVEYGPNDILFEAGELADCAYFLSRGKVRLLNKSQRASMTLKENGYNTHFGELSLLVNSVRIVQAQCITFSEFYVLHTIDFLETIMDFPQELSFYIEMARKILLEAAERRVKRKRCDRQRDVLATQEDRRQLTGIINANLERTSNKPARQSKNVDAQGRRPMRSKSGLRFARMNTMKALNRYLSSSKDALGESSSGPAARQEAIAEIVEGRISGNRRSVDSVNMRYAFARKQYRSKTNIIPVIELPVEKTRRGTWAGQDISQSVGGSSVVGGHFLTDLPVDKTRRESWLARVEHSLELDLEPGGENEAIDENEEPMSPSMHSIIFPGHAITDVPRDQRLRHEWVDKADALARQVTPSERDETEKVIADMVSDDESSGIDAGIESDEIEQQSFVKKAIRRCKTSIRLRSSTRRGTGSNTATTLQRLTGYRLRQKLELFKTPMWESAPCMRDVSSDVFPWHQDPDAIEGESEDEEQFMEGMSALFLLEDDEASTQTRLGRARQHLRAVVMRKSLTDRNATDKASLQKAKRERAVVAGKDPYARVHSYHSASEAIRSGHFAESEETVLRTLQRSAELKRRMTTRGRKTSSIFTSHASTAGGKFGAFDL
ncbi:Potassium voltage-gated channel sub H member 5 [Perkinsus chesapeaki]|uniref:Potassium voltage-gated channel sub H member 5 n=1 Tax=Perkinsus chesapeaki TaxID=330153 RepID=A0A7J6N2V6_PERCH|nr:Potassium voltage-gated channel sub H member 5 [Perkinsus chesapeaki]